MKKIQKFIVPIIFLSFGIVSFIRGIIYLDSDFGWQVRLGELIIKSGISTTDPFSYTMPSYPLVNHEWLTSVLIYLIYKNLGIWVLSATFTIIFLSCLYIIYLGKNKSFSILSIVLTGSVMLSFFGIRAQVISWVFFAILLKIMLDEDLWKKWKYFIPFLFLPWANLHGGFAVGIFIIFMTFVFNSIKNKTIDVTTLSILILSFVFTLINPYGISIWHEVWMQISDNSLRWKIVEWAPSILYISIPYQFLLVISALFVFLNRQKLKSLHIFIYLLLLLMAISALRHIPLWAIAASLIFTQALYVFYKEIPKNKVFLEKIRFIKKALVFILILIFLTESTLSILRAYVGSEKIFYPIKAINSLKKQNTKGKIFTIYDWGGYMVWKLPQEKVFIDGIMPFWKQDKVPNGESKNAFADYNKMLSEKTFFQETVNKYDIKYFLLPEYLPPKVSGSDTGSFYQQAKSIFEDLISNARNKSLISLDLTKFGMKKIYDDGQSVIYENKN